MRKLAFLALLSIWLALPMQAEAGPLSRIKAWIGSHRPHILQRARDRCQAQPQPAELIPPPKLAEPKKEMPKPHHATAG